MIVLGVENALTLSCILEKSAVDCFFFEVVGSESLVSLANLNETLVSVHDGAGCCRLGCSPKTQIQLVDFSGRCISLNRAMKTDLSSLAPWESRDGTHVIFGPSSRYFRLAAPSIEPFQTQVQPSAFFKGSLLNLVLQP